MVWARGGDKGRDIVAFTTEEAPLGLQYERKWVVQCKYRKKFPPKAEISNDIASAQEHEPDFWVLATSAEPTSSMLDYVMSFDRKSGFRVFAFTREHLEEQLAAHPDVLAWTEEQVPSEALVLLCEMSDGTSVYYDEQEWSIVVTHDGESLMLAGALASRPVLSPGGGQLAYIAPLEFEAAGEVFKYDAATKEASMVLACDRFGRDETPYSVSWLTDDLLLVVIGYLWGTVSMGGNLWLCDVRTGQLELYKEPGERQQIIVAAREKDTVVLRLAEFDEDFNDHTFVVDSVDLSDLMQFARDKGME